MEYIRFSANGGPRTKPRGGRYRPNEDDTPEYVKSAERAKRRDKLEQDREHPDDAEDAGDEVSSMEAHDGGLVSPEAIITLATVAGFIALVVIMLRARTNSAGFAQ